jgi:hypothetical protein
MTPAEVSEIVLINAGDHLGLAVFLPGPMRYQ